MRGCSRRLVSPRGRSICPASFAFLRPVLGCWMIQLTRSNYFGAVTSLTFAMKLMDGIKILRSDSLTRIFIMNAVICALLRSYFYSSRGRHFMIQAQPPALLRWKSCMARASANKLRLLALFGEPWCEPISYARSHDIICATAAETPLSRTRGPTIQCS